MPKSKTYNSSQKLDNKYAFAKAPQLWQNSGYQKTAILLK